MIKTTPADLILKGFPMIGDEQRSFLLLPFESLFNLMYTMIRIASAILPFSIITFCLSALSQRYKINSQTFKQSLKIKQPHAKQGQDKLFNQGKEDKPLIKNQKTNASADNPKFIFKNTGKCNNCGSDIGLNDTCDYCGVRLVKHDLALEN